MNPKISDFGMIKVFITTHAEANTNRVGGTCSTLRMKSSGYMASEYAIGGIFSEKSDAWQLWKEGVAIELMNPTLHDSYCEEQVLKCINLALLCVEHNLIDRPNFLALKGEAGIILIWDVAEVITANGRKVKDLCTNISLHRDAEIEKNGILRLTNDRDLVQGQAFYSLKIQFKNSTNGEVSSFSSSFGLGIVPRCPELGGHGITFTISPSKELKVLPTAYLRLFNKSNEGIASNHLFAVEFDTVQTPDFNYIDGNHVGIDINSLISRASSAAAYFDDSSTKQNLNLTSGKPILAWIDYDASENLLNVTISPHSFKPRLPLLSFNVNLSPIFHEFMYIGFSSATGLLSSSQYILGWSFKINGQAGALDPSSLPSIPDKNEQTEVCEHKTAKWGRISVLKAIVAIVAGLIVILILLINLFHVNLQTEKFLFDLMSEAKELEIDGKKGFNLKVYRASSIMSATNNFSFETKLGKAGFGPVYKGLLPDGQEVAIKRLSERSKHGLVGFKNELIIVAKLQHTNLVRLLGFCIQGEEKILVYEYMPNNSLDTYIFGGIFSEKSDVFSFEVLILEIISGRRSNNNIFYDGQPLNLVAYAWQLWKEGAAIEPMNPTLHDSYCEDQVLRWKSASLGDDTATYEVAMTHLTQLAEHEFRRYFPNRWPSSISSH
ncbi:L-type lectin-domain containing receptor kinase S.4-like [Pistacia vera]|uniref:L-type lectin-domain containing receptor kinase S.4-like n=1 Tax=Pistacia vera TaxID=55513 RepID=UPI001262F81E|nr:L-type lectin-domain containing receptor kinase S.4-like [Pistacia vera]